MTNPVSNGSQIRTLGSSIDQIKNNVTFLGIDIGLSLDKRLQAEASSRPDLEAILQRGLPSEMPTSDDPSPHLVWGLYHSHQSASITDQQYYAMMTLLYDPGSLHQLASTNGGIKVTDVIPKSRIDEYSKMIREGVNEVLHSPALQHLSKQNPKEACIITEYKAELKKIMEYNNKIILEEATIIDISEMDQRINDLSKKLESFKHEDIDNLTGLHGRKTFYEFATNVIGPLLGQPGHAGAIIIDLDFFKKYNDEFGHGTGDLILRLSAEVIRDSLTPGTTKLPVRWGGEEFVVFYQGLDATGIHDEEKNKIQLNFGRKLALKYAKEEGLSDEEVTRYLSILDQKGKEVLSRNIDYDRIKEVRDSIEGVDDHFKMLYFVTISTGSSSTEPLSKSNRDRKPLRDSDNVYGRLINAYHNVGKAEGAKNFEPRTQLIEIAHIIEKGATEGPTNSCTNAFSKYTDSPADTRYKLRRAMVDLMVYEADFALYKSKAAGRNRSTPYGDVHNMPTETISASQP